VLITPEIISKWFMPWSLSHIQGMFIFGHENMANVRKQKKNDFFYRGL